MGAGSSFQRVDVLTQRTYGADKAPYLVTIMTGLASGKDERGDYISPVLQCRCVVDDFGNLVPVRGWM